MMSLIFQLSLSLLIEVSDLSAHVACGAEVTPND